MHSYCKLATISACVLALAGAVLPAMAAEDKPKKKDRKEKRDDGRKKEETKPGKEVEGERGKLQIPIAKGNDAKGLKIPFFNLDGRLQMTFNIGLASRLDDDHLQMEHLQVETFDDKGVSEMTIELPRSVLDVQTRVLSTEEQVTIRRSDFEITGQKMQFNTDTKQGKLAGNVRMVIFNLAEETAR